MFKQCLRAFLLGVFCLGSCSENQTATPSPASPSFFRMAGGSATGNALNFLRTDTAPSPAAYSTEPLVLPVAPPYAHGPWAPPSDTSTISTDSSAKSLSPSP